MPLGKIVLSPFVKGCLFDYLPEDFLNFPKEIK